MAETLQKPSWLANLLANDQGAPAPIPAESPTPAESPAPQTPIPSGTPSNKLLWANSVTLGKGTLSDDPMSGSIMMLLNQNGFHQKIESGAQNGHTFTIIHNAPSTEFLMVEQWFDNGEPRKNYQAFSIKKLESKPSIAAQEIVPPHPILVTLRNLENELDALIDQTKRFA